MIIKLFKVISVEARKTESSMKIPDYHKQEYDTIVTLYHIYLLK